MKDWTNLRVLSAIVQEGSLAAAGRRLGIHHVTVGRRLSELEQELGVKLIDRLPRRAVPTAAGAEIAGQIGQIEAVVDTVARLGRAGRDGLSGTVSISAPPLAATQWIAPGLKPLLAREPGLRVEIRSNAGIASLAKGEADIAVRLVRPDQPGLIARRVARVELHLCASREVAKQPASKWRFIGYDRELAHLPHSQWLETYAGSRPIVLRSSDVHVQLAAARAGIGVALLPPTAANGVLVAVDPGTAPPARDAWLVVHPDLRRSAAVRAVLDHLAKVLGGTGAGD